MIAKGTTEKRLSDLEAKVARIHAEIKQTDPAGKPWWEEIRGTFANDPIYDQAMRLGRKHREARRRRQTQQKSRRNGRA